MALRSALSALSLAKRYSYYPSGYCLRFVRSMYNVPARYLYASDAWKATRFRHNSVPPKGVPVWWTNKNSSGRPGHVAISDGGGYVISTDWPSRGRVGRVSISRLTNSWNKRYRGWSEDINGYRVYPKAISYRKLRAAGRIDPPRSTSRKHYRLGTLRYEYGLVRLGVLSSRYRDGHYGTATLTATRRIRRRWFPTFTSRSGLPGRYIYRRFCRKFGYKRVP